MDYHTISILIISNLKFNISHGCVYQKKQNISHGCYDGLLMNMQLYLKS